MSFPYGPPIEPEGWHSTEVEFALLTQLSLVQFSLGSTKYFEQSVRSKEIPAQAVKQQNVSKFKKTTFGLNR